MRLFIFLFLLLISNNIMADKLLYKTLDAILLYDVPNNRSMKLLDLGKEDKYYSIGQIYQKNDSLFFLLYNKVQYLGFLFENEIHEKLYLVENEKCTLISTNILRKTGHNYELELINPNGDRSIEIIERFEERYSPYKKNESCFETNGSIYLKNKDAKILLLESVESKNGILCGYYNPDLSSDRHYLISVYECSKYNRKKHLGGATLVELNIYSKEIKMLNIVGSIPKYSKSGIYILVKKNKGYLLLNKNNNYDCSEKNNMLEAYWILN